MGESRLDVNFFDRAVIEDPYGIYEEIRAAGPVVWNDVLQAWMLPNYADCVATLSDPSRFSVAIYRDPKKVWWFEAPNMVMLDPPEQHRLRKPLTPMLTRSAVTRWEERVGEVVDELLAPLAAGSGDYDVIQDFALIPTVILAEMIGVPKDRQEDFRRWSSTIAGSTTYGQEDPATLEAMKRANEELKAYLEEEFDRHRREQPDDILTTMLQLPPEAGMSEAEIRSTISVLLLAGYDTTSKLLSNCLVVLERHPDQRRLVVDNPGLVPAAIEEILRWWGVLHGVLRTAEVDTDIAGTPIAKGDIICTMPAAANRDPRRWRDPLRFDVQRPQKAHMGFGYGAHLCIGAWLARVEAKVALERLLRLAPEYSLVDVDYGNAWFIRGPQRGLVQIGSPVHV
jgi:cytochrome P450